MVVLDNVHIEDRIIVRNVVAAIESLKLEKVLLSWTVDVGQGCYTVNAYINDTADCEFSKTELDTIHDVNPLRVQSASIARTAGKMRIKVKISDRDEPLMLTETQVLVVRKRHAGLSSSNILIFMQSNQKISWPIHKTNQQCAPHHWEN